MAWQLRSDIHFSEGSVSWNWKLNFRRGQFKPEIQFCHWRYQFKPEINFLIKVISWNQKFNFVTVGVSLQFLIEVAVISQRCAVSMEVVGRSTSSCLCTDPEKCMFTLRFEPLYINKVQNSPEVCRPPQEWSDLLQFYMHCAFRERHRHTQIHGHVYLPQT